MDERRLAEKLIAYESVNRDGIIACAEFVRAWLEAREIRIEQLELRGLPILIAEVGPRRGPSLLLHGHLDVVPAHPEQFKPRLEGDRLFGRGAYDMKGALAAMMLALQDLADQERVRVRLAVVPDEESEEVDYRATDLVVESGCTADFAITGEPTQMLVGVAAKGVLMLRVEVSGRAAHGSTPWEGDNAIIKALDVFRIIESLPFSRESSELFDRPSINLGRIVGGDAINKVPDYCLIEVDVRYLPGQDPDRILAEIAAIPDTSVAATFIREPVEIDPDLAYVRALNAAAAPHHGAELTGVGRDGASDAVSFIRAGIPAVEFGPEGGGHHGPEEWVSVGSLRAYRNALREFALGLGAATGSTDPDASSPPQL